MCPQVGFVRKTAGAIGASEGFFTGMRPYMSLEQPRPGETFATNVTFARKRMGPDMHFEGR